MANPQKENGFTSIANEIMEALAKIRIPGEARQVLDVILRQTYGFGRKNVAFKPGFLSKATGLKRQNVNRAIGKLSVMNLITVIKNGYAVINNDYATQITFNKDYEYWIASSKTITLKASSKTITPVIKNDSLPIKETLKKNNNPPTPQEGDDRKKQKTWKNDFSIYLGECEKSAQQLLSDPGWIVEQEVLNPDVDIRLTMRKAYKNYWGTEVAWSKKKRQKIKEINWKLTWQNALSSKMNRVYKRAEKESSDFVPKEFDFANQIHTED